MKFLIWLFALGIPSYVTLFLEKIGIHIGGFLPTVILYGIAVWVAKVLCEKWELHKRGIDIAVIDGKASADGKTRREYLVEHTPKFIIGICEDRHTADALRDLLKPYVKSGKITQKMADALAEEFGDNPYEGYDDSVRISLRD